MPLPPRNHKSHDRLRLNKIVGVFGEYNCGQLRFLDDSDAYNSVKSLKSYKNWLIYKINTTKTHKYQMAILV